MTHYQTLATIAIRIVGFVFMALGGVFCLSGFVSAYMIRDERQSMYLLMMNLCFLVFSIGFNLFILSKHLAKLACIGLNKSSDGK